MNDYHSYMEERKARAALVEPGGCPWRAVSLALGLVIGLFSAAGVLRAEDLARLGTPAGDDVNPKVELCGIALEAVRYQEVLTLVRAGKPAEAEAALKALGVLGERYPDHPVPFPTGRAEIDPVAQRYAPLGRLFVLAASSRPAEERARLLAVDNRASDAALARWRAAPAARAGEAGRFAVADRHPGTTGAARALGECVALAWEDGRLRDAAAAYARLAALSGPGDRLEPTVEVMGGAALAAVAHPDDEPAILAELDVRLGKPAAASYALHLGREVPPGAARVTFDGAAIEAPAALRAEIARIRAQAGALGWGVFCADVASPGGDFSGVAFAPPTKRLYSGRHGAQLRKTAARAGIDDLMRRLATGGPARIDAREVRTYPALVGDCLYIHQGDRWRRFHLPAVEKGVIGQAKPTPGRLSFTRIENEPSGDPFRGFVEIFRGRESSPPRPLPLPTLAHSFGAAGGWVAAFMPALEASKGEIDVNTLVVFSASDGALLWQTPAPGEAAGAAEHAATDFSALRFGGAPLVAGDAVFAAGVAERGGNAETTAACFDAASGAVRWRRAISRAKPFDEALALAGSGAPEPTAPVLRAGLLFVGTNAGAVAALRATDGAPVWVAKYRSELAATERRDRRKNVVGRDLALRGWARGVVVAGADVALVAPADTTRLLAFDLATGRPRWATGEGAPAGNLLLGEFRGRAYAQEAAGALVEISLRNGKITHRAEEMKGSIVGEALLTARGIFALTESELLRWDLATRAVAERWPLPKETPLSKARGGHMLAATVGGRRFLAVTDSELFTLIEMEEKRP